MSTLACMKRSPHKHLAFIAGHPVPVNLWSHFGSRRNLTSVCLFPLLMLEDRPRVVAVDILEYSGHGGLTREDRHYDDVG